MTPNYDTGSCTLGQMGRLVVVRGSGDVGSAVAHRLHTAGFRVVLHDVPAPAAPRRGMAFTDAVYEGSASLAGVTAIRTNLPGLGAVPAGEIPVVTEGIGAVLAALQPAVLVDARMRKRSVPEPQRGSAPLTIGLGPGFVAGENVDLLIETRWGDALGTIVTQGPSAPMGDAPRRFEGHDWDRFIYAPAAGVFRTACGIADRVSAGQVVATLDGADLRAPLDGILRGLSHDGAEVARGQKCVEVDPRGDPAMVFGLGERPAKIAEGVLRAITSWA